uniref:Uncharacterized protein n=1 Tax=Oryza brachyantha TaxID=4533 RepID=J3M8B7_ORYBR
MAAAAARGGGGGGRGGGGGGRRSGGRRGLSTASPSTAARRRARSLQQIGVELLGHSSEECGDGRGGDAADGGEGEGAGVVDGDAVGVAGAGEELAEAHRVGLHQPGQLRAARLVRPPRPAPVLHVAKDSM